MLSGSSAKLQNPLPGGRLVNSLSIAVVCHSYPPVVGGSEREAQRVCASLIKRGHRVEVLCAGGHPMPPVANWIDPEGVPVRIFGGQWRDPWRGYSYALGVAWTLFKKRKKYDIVYFLMQGLQLATGVPMARWLGKPVFMKFSGSNIIRHMAKSWLGRMELRLLRRWAAKVIVLNDGMVEEAIETGLGTEKLAWLPNPVDTEKFCPATAAEKSILRAELGVPQTAKVVLYVGRLAPEKELESLIHAFAIVAQEDPDAQLVLVGDGPVHEALAAQARVWMASGRVRFTGMVDENEVRKWTQASDLFALVSSLEGLPCSLIEAMSAGLPAVVSGIPANRQLIEPGVNGLVAELKNELEIAGCLRQLLADAGLRARMGEKGRALILKQYALETVTDAYEELFFQLTNKTGAQDNPKA